LLSVGALIATVPAARSSIAAGSGDAVAQADGGGEDRNPTFASGSASDMAGPSAVQLSPVSFVSTERRAGGATLSPLEAERNLRSPVFLEQMDRMREDLRKELNLDSTVAISAAGASLGGSIIYLLWLIRGGVLMGSYLSALPAWQVLDPLPVLERLKDPTQDNDELSDDFSEYADDRLKSLRGY